MLFKDTLLQQKLQLQLLIYRTDNTALITTTANFLEKLAVPEI